SPARSWFRPSSEPSRARDLTRGGAAAPRWRGPCYAGYRGLLHGFHEPRPGCAVTSRTNAMQRGSLMSDGERRARVLPLRPASEIYDDDAVLARALIERRPNAPAALWARFAPMVHRMLRRTLGPGAEIEDVVQEVFLCVFQKVSGLREPRALRAFVISVTALTARYELRRRVA